MSDETALLPCPYCGGEAHVIASSDVYGVECWGELCSKNRLEEIPTEAEAIAAWNIRAPVEHDGWFYLPKPKESIVQYGEQRTEKTEHGYKVTQPVEVLESAIRSWGDDLGEYTMKRICEAWNTRTHGTLTAEQVMAIAGRHQPDYCSDTHVCFDWQAIADELNGELGSDAKPCYAADENYKRCKYSVNRGWCDDAPFLVWDDTGHLFITMGGLKTWDVTDDAKKWFAELGSGTCKNIAPEYLDFLCSECGFVHYHSDENDTGDGNDWAFCPRCGRTVVER